MDTQETTTVQDNATEQPESTTTGGEVSATDTSTDTTGESGKEASDGKGTKGAEGLFDGMDAPTLHKSYKSLQSEFTKVNTAIKKLERFGGADSMAQWAEYLQNNPRFKEWVEREQMSKTTGLNEEEMDDTTRKAYETVKKIADSSTDMRVRQILQNEIAPLQENLKKQLLDTHFKSMDEKYGPDWQELRDKMSEMSADLPDRIKNKPTLGDIEDLYFKALRETGKFDAYAAKIYQKQLSAKQKKATDKPGSAIPSAPKQYKNIAEAFADAKRQHNM
jgi:hypothetical protein